MHKRNICQTARTQDGPGAEDIEIVNVRFARDESHLMDCRRASISHGRDQRTDDEPFSVSAEYGERQRHVVEYSGQKAVSARDSIDAIHPLRMRDHVRGIRSQIVV